jgi:rhamnosyltransferase
MKDDSILFVIVLYKIRLEDSITYSSILNSLLNFDGNLDLLVYDNSPGNYDYRRDIPNLNITYVADQDNSGVSKAYNYASTVASKHGKKWMILLDQDTLFPANFINMYIKGIEANPNEKLLAPVMLTDDNKVISPCIFKLGRGFYGKETKPGIYNLKSRSLINCGLCIELEAFKKINGYNEKIKLDFSDHDFVRRFSEHVRDLFVLIDLQVKHQLSTTMKNSLLSEKVRFDYYLEGAKQFSSSFTEGVLVNVNAFLRAVKLGVMYKDFIFIKKFITQILSRNA